MSKLKQLAYGLTISLFLISLVNSVYAAGPSRHPRTYTEEGRIEAIDLNNGTLILDDTVYTFPKDVTVKTVRGQIGRLGQLYKGKHVRLVVYVSHSRSEAPVIRTIYMY